MAPFFSRQTANSSRDAGFWRSERKMKPEGEAGTWSKLSIRKSPAKAKTATRNIWMKKEMNFGG